MDNVGRESLVEPRTQHTEEGGEEIFAVSERFEKLRRAIIRAVWGEWGYELLSSAGELVNALPIMQELLRLADTEDERLLAEVTLEGAACRALVDHQVLDRLAGLDPAALLEES